MKPWTSGEHVQVAYRILGALRAALGFESVSSLLLAEDSRILRKCLEELRPKLEDWRNFPGAQSAFVWILHHIKFPMLSQHTFQVGSLNFILSAFCKNKREVIALPSPSSGRIY